MEYGKIITKESFHNKKRTTKETYYQIPVPIKDKSSAMTEIIRAIDLISSRRTRKMVISLEADRGYKLKLMTKEYKVEE